MGYHLTTRNREYKEGSIGRRRSYHCRECHLKFQEDRQTPLPEGEGVCPSCRKGYVYVFTDKNTKEDRIVKGFSVETATLRAWRISPNLTFKVPQPSTINNGG